MQRTLFSLLILFAHIAFLQAQTADLRVRLLNMPGVSIEMITPGKGDGDIYELMVRQMIDHEDSLKGFFYQKVYLNHVGYDRPAVIVTEGYNRDRPRTYELTRLLNANQIQVEHRFFGKSVPDSMDYRFLNLKQATADLHHIRQLLGEVYEQKWISTGISKGGATTIFYRYFYPDDVAVSVPYVAPINRAYEETRLYTFLDTIGSEACRMDIDAFQRRMLRNREEILPLLKFYSLGARTSYTYLNLEQAFEYAVLEYPFSFWQYGQDCSKIPTVDTPLHEALIYLLEVSGIDFFSDASVDQYVSHYYQSATEMGYYGYRTKPFEDLIETLPTGQNPMALFFPKPMTDAFNGELLKKVNEWLAGNQANQMAYIYGGVDTWTGSAVPENDKVDAEWFVLPGKHHGNARIKGMTEAEYERFVACLERWLELELD
ncbi:hypothetical protein FUA23_16435 [Neolewinella aurantiaca]|uniref:PS-10 peptidase S37 n=1 Tax=Neolewinella aurantiaca TaxID=2602767 RepID=A0A5C7FEV3_9BACT|nr:S28 family serine protease [Neolewinella aurantiaca]TXF88068.1 hypothetical protein FUA23_16435 [Neolewinella aurantiaca]